MAIPLLLIIGAVLAVSAISLAGALSFFIKTKSLDKILFYLVSFSAGTLLGAAFLDLMPEALEGTEMAVFNVLASVLCGIIGFFVLERFIHWHHFHKGTDAHPFTYLNLIGDGIHNFLDGVAIAAAFITNTQVGISTTLAVIAHEIPQEMGDFGILLYGGLSKKKALVYNFLSALVALGGALAVILLSSFFTRGVINVLLAFTAGGFIYIATADLVPEMHKERELNKMIPQLLLFLGGIFIIGVLKSFLAE
ncbi:MAG: ZIP family metal transporter [Candidatus Aenigmarchaeota archaeon]|nr:ZIP family metal transporter [Candidatus Aenigmarchaeota archaeon]MBI5229450.1 ZIP family metal transporter [Candidatus Micrarchaeota archaeon]